MRPDVFEGYIFVVDTDQYSGNFERQMTAYVTGCFGDCGVGDEHAKMFKNEVDAELAKRLKEIVVSISDEKGCWRPASIYSTPEFFNDGFGNAWPDEKWGSQEVIDAFKSACKEYDHDEEELKRHPSYQSVAIFLRKIPDDDLLELMVERAKSFCKDPQMKYEPKKLKVLGIRLVQEQVVTTLIKDLT